MNLKNGTKRRIDAGIGLIFTALVLAGCALSGGSPSIEEMSYQRKAVGQSSSAERN